MNRIIVPGTTGAHCHPKSLKVVASVVILYYRFGVCLLGSAQASGSASPAILFSFCFNQRNLFLALTYVCVCINISSVVLVEHF